MPQICIFLRGFCRRREGRFSAENPVSAGIFEEKRGNLPRKRGAIRYAGQREAEVMWAIAEPLSPRLWGEFMLWWGVVSSGLQEKKIKSFFSDFSANDPVKRC
ncbi:MAG: hypothetical protein MPK62_04885 [Alphaproteobacteria bacterium]|nr:hypothetical protein [Alphaproteobacteria bacterium]